MVLSYGLWGTWRYQLDIAQYWPRPLWIVQTQIGKLNPHTHTEFRTHVERISVILENCSEKISDTRRENFNYLGKTFESKIYGELRFWASIAMLVFFCETFVFLYFFFSLSSWSLLCMSLNFLYAALALPNQIAIVGRFFYQTDLVVV